MTNAKVLFRSHFYNLSPVTEPVYSKLLVHIDGKLCKDVTATFATFPLIKLFIAHIALLIFMKFKLKFQK